MFILQKKDLSCADDDEFLMHICQICWHKITDFDQFYVQIENIQDSYNKQFLKEDGTFISFEDQSQFYVEVDGIHSEFKAKLSKIEDKKPSLMEPFYTINVEENEDKSSEEIEMKPHIVDEVDFAKLEQTSNDEISASKDAPLSEDDRDYEMYSDDDRSSDSSYEEVEEKPKKSTKTASKSKKKSSETSKRSRKLKRKFTVQATMNVLDEDNERLLRYIQMKCDLCNDDRMFETFSDIQVHFLDAHNQSGYIICCNRKFRRIGRVLQHCTWHDNPEAFK